MKEDRHFVTALVRGLEVLRCFTQDRVELGSTEIARLTGLTQSTAWRLCYTLQKAGYLVPGGDPEKLRASPAVLTLGAASVAQTGIARIALPRMREIAQRYQSSVSLAARDGLQMVILQRAEGATVLKLNFQVGSAFDMARSAVGAAYLAAAAPEERERLLRQLHAASPDTWADDSAYLEEARRHYQEHGYVLNLRRYHPDVNALGVPVIAPDGGRIMAMNCGGANSVVGRTQLEGPIAQDMKSLAQELSAALIV